jgi:hypothetical protein
MMVMVLLDSCDARPLILLLYIEGNSKAHRTSAEVWQCLESRGGSTQTGSIIPTPASDGSCVPDQRPLWIINWRNIVVLAVKPILTPFGNITVHVEEAKSIRLKLADGGGENEIVCRLYDTPIGKASL